MIMYVIYNYNYSDSEILGVFDDEEKAEAALAKMVGTPVWRGPHIQKWLVNTLVEDGGYLDD